MKKIWFVFMIIIFIFPSSATITGNEQTSVQKNILIIHSYNQGFPWSDDLQRGITEGLDNSKYTIFTEYLDSYRQQIINPSKIAIIQSYSHMNLLCIVVTDNPAYDVIMELRETYFPNVPILFAGLNGFTQKDLPDNMVTGIAQNNSFDSFFEWIHYQMPSINTLLVCGADTGTTRGVMAQINEAVTQQTNDFNIVLINQTTYDEQLDAINVYDKDSTILYVAGSFGVLNHDQYANMLSTRSDIPTFCGVKTSIVGNVIGGYVVDPYEHGKIINSYINKLNDNIPVAILPMISKPLEQVIFNYNGLEYHNLLMTLLPKDAILVNNPNYNIELTKQTLIFIALIFGLLLITVIALLIILTIRRNAQRSLENINTELVEKKMELEANGEELIANQEALTLQYNQLVESSQHIQDLIDFDKITGLYNDIKFTELLETNFSIDTPFTFLYLSIANLDSLTFTHGKKIYETLLEDVSEFLVNIFDQNDLIGITSNKHFLIATTLMNSESDRILQKLVQYFSTPHYNDTYTLLLDYRIGISTFPVDSTSIDDIILFGSLAITQILDNPLKKVSFYNASILQQLNDTNQLQNDIEFALDSNQFILYYQPKYDLIASTITGLEALIRWNHPDGTLKSPSFFIDEAERSGQIIKIGNWVIDSVCKTISQNSDLLKNIPISLNLSGQHFSNKMIIKELQMNTEKYGILPQTIELEITETSLVTNQEYCSLILSELRQLGFKIALDDFGTGYASISYIKEFPIDRIKIDQSFTGMITDSKYESLIKTMIELAKELDFEVTVEGIETTQQYAIIKKYSPQELQGYLFSRPMPFDDLFLIKR